MASPTIAVINFTSTLTDDPVREAIHAVNRQIREHFQPIWGCARTLKPYMPTFDISDPNSLAEEPIPADSVMYLVDESTLPGALGFHDLNSRDKPFGFVFVLDPNDWTTTLSHEALELILDPTVNVFVPGPDPRNPRNTVLHTYEACDAVERLSYNIGTVLVSDFVKPGYFTVGEIARHQNDFLGVGLKSFGVTPGSHLGFFDLATGQFVEFNGQLAPPQPAFAARAQRHEHVKPHRNEQRIQAMLADYQNGRMRPGASGLKQMRGVTRTARYHHALAFAHS